MRVRILNQFSRFAHFKLIRSFSAKSPVSTMPEVSVDEVRRFMVDSLVKVGAPKSEAEKHAALLIHADCVGHLSHGLNRLEFYINDMINGSTVPDTTPVILKESPGTAWVEGNNALGATVSSFCMNLAIKKAKEVGVGVVSVKGSNHFGMAGYWALQAEKEGLIGMAVTNSSPLLVPTRAKNAALGTNPIAMAAPANNGDSFVADFATTTVALGKIEVQMHKEEPIPEGWAMDKDGNVTTDAHVAFKAGRLLPVGGREQTSGYKGYALSGMVEILCSGLSGSLSTHNIRSWEVDAGCQPPNLGHCFIAIDPGCFAPGFTGRVTDCLQTWRNMEPVDPSLPVLAPGDKERINAEKTAKIGKISYSEGQIRTCNAMAERIGVKPIQVL